MCTLPPCCPNDSQKCEWKIINTELTQRKKRKEKTSFWKHKIGFLNFLRNNIPKSCDLPKFYNFLVNSQTLNDARRPFFKCCWYKILSYLELLLESSNLVQFCTKFRVMWVLFLLRNMQVCGYWYPAAYQYSKVIGFVKNFKEVYGY